MQSLAELWTGFPGTTQSNHVIVTRRKPLLFVEMCDWTDDTAPHPVKVMVVYKSPLVKWKSRIFRDAAEVILGYEAQDVLYERVIPDESMSYGAGVFQVLRLCDADNINRTLHPVDVVHEIIDSIYERAT